MRRSKHGGKGKPRFTITMDREVRLKARKLAKQDRRSFSGLLEVLIQNEAKRLGIAA